MGQNESKHPTFYNYDMSPAEMEKLKIEFEKYDDNKNQSLEIGELEAFLSNHMPELVTFSRVILYIFGTGKKGTINFENFKVFYKSLQKVGIDESDPSSLPMMIFSKLDKNNSCYLSAKELKKMWALLRPRHNKKKVSEKEVKELIRNQHPAQEQWGLSRDEFIKFFDSFLTTMPVVAEYEETKLPAIYGAGMNKNNQVGILENASVPGNIELPIGGNLRCMCAGETHSIFITDNCLVYGLGNNRRFQIGGDETEYITPTTLILHNKYLTWAAAGANFTVYLDEDGAILYFGDVAMNANERKPIIIPPENKIPYVYLTASVSRFAAIDKQGKIAIFSSDPRSQPTRCTLPKPAYDVACGNSNFTNKFFAIAVTVDGQVYGYEGLNKDLHHFAPIFLLKDVHVTRVFGYSHHLALLTRKGKVMIYGCGTSGQCGNGCKENNDTFKIVKGNKNTEFTDVAVGGEHSLLVSRDGQVFSCGNNKFFQLCIGKTSDDVIELTPTPLIKGRAVAAACGTNHSLVLIDSPRILHPGMAAFGIKQIH